MKATLTRLLASTALAAAIGLPALAAVHLSGNSAPALTRFVPDAGLMAPVTPAGWFGDDDDDDEGEDDDEEDDDCFGDDGDEGEGDDDDGDDDEGEDDEGDDDALCLGVPGNPAPAGSVAPPANGLFGSGTPPVAVTN